MISKNSGDHKDLVYSFSRIFISISYSRGNSNTASSYGSTSGKKHNYISYSSNTNNHILNSCHTWTPPKRHN